MTRRSILFVSAAGIAAAGVFFALYWQQYKQTGQRRHDTGVSFTPSAPPELAKFKHEILSGIDAVGRNDGPEAVRHLTSFSYGARPVEEYRLYYLANAYELAGNTALARQTLSRLWSSHPRMLYRQDAAFRLAALYSDGGFFREVADTLGALAGRTENDTVSAAARDGFIEHAFYIGDPGAALFAARNIIIENPRSAQARPAFDLVRRFESVAPTAPVTMTVAERVERIDSLIGAGDPQSAFNEAMVMDPASLPSPFKERVILSRGTALHLLHRYADSDTTLAPLFSGYFKYAIPALDLSVKNDTILSTAINPVSFKTVRVKQQVGTVKVRTKARKIISKPKFKIISKQVPVINLALQIKKDAYQHAAAEHLNDLLHLPLADNQRREVLLNLITRAEQKNQDAYMQTLISELVKIEPGNDTGLQRFWGQAWSAYTSGDLKTAASLFDYIGKNYDSINIKRQVAYWSARVMERQGRATEADAIYTQLANAPYEDLYAVSAQRRGAKRTVARALNPLEKTADEWPQIADRVAPPELRMAYELSSLGLKREAQLEIRANLNYANARFANAILGEIYYLDGASVASSRALRLAFPKLATVEQDSVPSRFIKMDFPLRYEDHIRKEARKRGVDPFLVMALIRQESMFSPEAKSGVGARGLMQIMTPTGRELSQRLGRRFTEASLTDPYSNIDMGVLYVRQLLDRNQGSIQLTAACYNAGIGNVAHWRRAAPSRPIDEFVEDIPFAETRGYVKRVTFYRSAYERFSQ
ncbi:MAG TPA: lytic transglycosylase domain-containing protein [Thermoanaerobaculia bacterium]|nr:lytic transglycosylase domain-containing protein [Thermoanaerobaculia bacterium]